jgi:hypothetical protein
MKEKFLGAIDGKFKIKVTFEAKEKGQVTRTCIPFDFGPSQKADAIDRSDKYHMLDLDSPDKPHNLALSENQIFEIEVLDERFDPAGYVTWQPNWIYPRDWGNKS